MSTAIEFNNVSKQYKLGLVSTKTLSHDLNRWWQTKILRKDDPYLKIGSVNDRTAKADSDYVWALKDIDFKVEQGDVVGIIGKNGAGKSTLLKLLSRVTNPTTGTIRARGRIASLLEVGTGFHPELTGRENIYMNGSIMGMSKSEITSKLDEIVAFSGCERYIDTPVKRYSSGMTVRLGFAIAAHLDPEILVVDEVLAVGDAEFQKKAIGKMQDVSNGEGRTVLFVSHNMNAVRNLCKSGVVLENGTIAYKGNINDSVDFYMNNNQIQNVEYIKITDQHRISPKDIIYRKLQFEDVRALNDMNELSTDEQIQFELTINRNNPNVDDFQVSIILRDMLDVRFATYVSNVLKFPNKSDVCKVRLCLSNHNLAQRKYKVQFDLGIKDYVSGSINYDGITNFMTLNVNYITKNPSTLYAGWDPAYGYILDRQSLQAVVL